MAFERQAGNDLSDGAFIKVPGQFHLIITQLDDPVQKKDGSIWADQAFQVHCEALAGNVAGQEKKTVKIRFGQPLPSHRDGGEYAGRLIDRFAVAVGLIGPQDKGKPYAVDGNVVNRQFVANLEHDTDEHDQPNGFMRVAGRGLEMYHVDDPIVARVPKDEKAIKYLPANQRRKPATNGAAANGNATAATNGNGANTGQQSQPQQTQAAGATGQNFAL